MSNEKMKSLIERLKQKGLPITNGNPRLASPKINENKKNLTLEDKWNSLLWNIDTAEEFGTESLNGLAIALGRIIQAEALSNMHFDARHSGRLKFDEEFLLWNFNKVITNDKKSLRDLLIDVEPFAPIDLSESIVIPGPWDRYRLLRAYQRLGPNKVDGPFVQTENFQAVIWTPWPLVWVQNGYHSSMATIVLDKGYISNIQTQSAEVILKNVYCDGKYWRRVGDKMRIARVRSLPMAGIFEIGRRLIGAPKPE